MVLCVRCASSGCRLRPWRHDDLDALVRHADDPRVARTLRDQFPQPYTRAEGERWIDHATNAGRARELAIEVDGEAVGGVGMVPGEDVYRYCAEVGYWLGHGYWGRGIMTDAMRAFSAHLLEERGFLRLEAPVFANNPASARVLEKAGFVQESIKRRAVVKAGELLDVWFYVRLRAGGAR
mgnify:CR=1 FL=1